MLPTAATSMRAVLVLIEGSVTWAVPLLGVLARSTVGKVFPPSVESRIETFAQFTGAAVVPATFQVTVCTPDHETGVLGEVTTNGPAAAVTAIDVLAAFTPPPPARLSRTI